MEATKWELSRSMSIDVNSICRIALINPGRNASFQPLNLAFIASYCEQALKGSVSIAIFDNAVNSQATIDAAAWKPHVVGFTCLSSDLLLVESTIRDMRSKLPASLFVCGGIHATIAPEDVLEAGADIAVIGEGEITFTEVVKCWRATLGNLAEPAWNLVDGLCFKANDGVRRTAVRAPISCIDNLPHPARHLLDNEAYAKRFFIQRGMRTNRVFTLHGSRGCPFRCYFCCVNFTVTGKVRLHSPAYIVDEMEYLANTLHARCIFFTDDTFLIQKDHTESLCREIMRRGLHTRVKWEAQLRSSLVHDSDVGLLRLMRSAGCYQVDIGFETGNQRMLELIKGKGISIDDHRRALRLAHDAGLEVLGTFIVANPTETYAEMMDTISFIQTYLRNGCLTRFQYGIVVPFPGTKLYEMAAADGVVPDRYRDLLVCREGSGFGSVLCTRRSSSEEVADVVRRLESLSKSTLKWEDRILWAIRNSAHDPRLVAGACWNVIKNLIFRNFQRSLRTSQ